MPPPVLQLARTIADGLIAQGALAVILFGSQARGDAQTHSDLDLLALGEGPDYQLSQVQDVLVSTSWRTANACREVFTQPLAVGTVIPGWRCAVLLRDPAGLAADLQVEAQHWTWTGIETACDDVVAAEITGLAEEVHKLVGTMGGTLRLTAAVQRNLLALRLAVIMALHHRLLCETENRLWALVAARLGETWAAAQARAFGLGGESFSQTCQAALALYGLAARAALPLLDDRQRAVVEHACRIAGHPL